MEGEERSMTAQHWLSQHAEFIALMFLWESQQKKVKKYLEGFYIGLALGHGKKEVLFLISCNQIWIWNGWFLSVFPSPSLCTAEAACTDAYWHFLWNALKWALMDSVGKKPLPSWTNNFFLSHWNLCSKCHSILLFKEKLLVKIFFRL